MYTKEHYKKEILELMKSQGYNPVIVAKVTFSIFMNHQRDLDSCLYEKMLDIANMDMGQEFEMTETEFKEFIEKM